MATAFNERTWLDWLVKVRIIVITCLVLMQIGILTVTSGSVSRGYFVVVVVAWYSVALAWMHFRSRWKNYELQARAQVFVDLAFACAVVYTTGGVDTYFNFLYPLIVLVASIMLAQGWAYITAGVAFVLFGATLELTYYKLVPSFGSSVPDPKSLLIVILSNLVAYLLIAYLAGKLSARLRQVDVELQDQRGEFENLQAFHQNIIDSISGGLVTTDLEGHIRLVNPAGATMLERTQQELLGKGVETLFLDRLPDVAMVPVRGEVRLSTPSGKQRTFGITKSMLRVPDQGVVGFIFTFNDLTEIRRLEREIRMRDRLAAVGRLAAGIAHEIRNPLTSIAGSAQMFTTVPTLNEEQRTLADIIIRESERLNAIITDFLTYSREKSLKLERGDLIPLLEDTLMLLQNRPGTNVKIVRDYEATQAFGVIDGDKLKQVFWNLCENAMRAMSNSGTLDVRVRASGNHWWISFRDSGPGIDPQQMDKIFEPFQSGFSGGTGLGLAIVYQIVQAHDGKIAVRSEPGKGAEFIVQFKRAAEQPAVVHASDSLAQVAPLSPLRAAALAAAKGD